MLMVKVQGERFPLGGEATYSGGVHEINDNHHTKRTEALLEIRQVY